MIRRALLGGAAGMILALPFSVQAEEPYEPRVQPTLAVTRTSGPIQIDGNLEDEGWKNAAIADRFIETSPGDLVKPPVRSEAWVTYDQHNLYVALIAYDNPDEVRVSVRDRDNIYRDDYFGIMLDTYGESSWGYELFVNALGIQGDLRMEGSGGEDGSFDLIWESKGRVTETGYQVEIAIPFASLRFPNREEQTWRFNVWRDRQRDVRNRYSWSAISRDDPCFMCQWGYLKGITGVQPGKNLDVIASVIGTQAGELADSDDPRSSFENDDPKGKASLNMRYAVTSNSSAELAVNPDFSQVESDAGRIDVNNTFALFFPERRPFFQEGSDLFNTWIDAVYTRSINNPDVAAKLLGEFGNTSVVYLFGHDDASPLIVPFEERSEFLLMDDSYSNVVRTRTNLRDGSRVGLLLTDRRMSGDNGSGTVVSADALFRFWQNYRLELQVAASRTEEPNDTTLSEDFNSEMLGDTDNTAAFDGENFWGSGIYASIERSARHFEFDFDYWGLTPTFRTDNGFTTRNDYHQTSWYMNYAAQPNREFLKKIQPSVRIGRIWNQTGTFKDEWLRPQVWAEFKGQTEISLEGLISRERFAGVVFDDIRTLNLWSMTRPSEMFSIEASAGLGKQIFRDFDEPEMGDVQDYGIEAEFKPLSRLFIEPEWNYSKMESRETGETLFEGYILRTRVTYNFSREWYLRLVTQYNDFSERFDFEPLLTYKLNPFTVFYIGAGNRYNYYDEIAQEKHGSERGRKGGTGLSGAAAKRAAENGSEWKLAERQIFAKVQYLYRF